MEFEFARAAMAATFVVKQLAVAYSFAEEEIDIT